MKLISCSSPVRCLGDLPSSSIPRHRDLMFSPSRPFRVQSFTHYPVLSCLSSFVLFSFVHALSLQTRRWPTAVPYLFILSVTILVCELLYLLSRSAVEHISLHTTQILTSRLSLSFLFRVRALFSVVVVCAKGSLGVRTPYDRT